ncbi:MAG: hypothetical protein Kow00117_11340 [Phototrophicales bacterium]|nr:MAG: hypothetical protein CUN56_07885 [Phototrophicales bacterium]RMG75646.1 MAG: hypothetical protein D6711_06080 [Chloroflexota bacterium]
MSELSDRIMSNKGSFERLVARIPGFKGYHEKEARRTADRMLRDHIAAELDERIKRMARIEKLILDNGGLAYMTKTRSAKSKIQLFRDKIATSMPGYDGMWAQMKIEAEDLDKIYAFDEAQVVYVDKFDAALDALEQAVLNKEELDVLIYELEQIGVEAIEAYNLREDVLIGLSKSV